MPSENVMAGIVESGVIADDSRLARLDEQISGQSEELYRAGLIQRFLVIWAYPVNLVLAGIAIASLATAEAPSPWFVLAAVLVPVVSVVVSAVLTYRHHFRVRASEAALRKLRQARREHVLEEFGAADDLLALHKRYREEIPDVVEAYRAESGRYRRVHNIFQAIIIVGSVVASTLVAASFAFHGALWAAVTVSLLVAVAAGFTGYFKYQERSFNLDHTADTIERQYHSVELRVGHYRRFSGEREAYAEFAHEVETLREEQSRRRQTLGQPAVAWPSAMLGK